jgi:hypothetical protein
MAIYEASHCCHSRQSNGDISSCIDLVDAALEDDAAVLAVGSSIGGDDDQEEKDRGERQFCDSGDSGTNPVIVCKLTSRRLTGKCIRIDLGMAVAT